MAPQRKASFPALNSLYERHRGFYRPLCEACADAASICFSESHASPTDIEVRTDGEVSLRELFWSMPSELARASWANRDDTTRDGAYSVSLAAVEAELGYVAVQRAETRTGADYYIGPPGTDLEEAHRLETSGVRSGDAREVSARLRQKIDQVRRGETERPGFACVVGFAARIVSLSKVEPNAEP